MQREDLERMVVTFTRDTLCARVMLLRLYGNLPSQKLSLFASQGRKKQASLS